MFRRISPGFAVLSFFSFIGCQGSAPANVQTPSAEPSATSKGSVTRPGGGAEKNQIARADFNRRAVRANMPVYWTADSNKNNAIDPDEARTLKFYGKEPVWTKNGAFTPEFETAYAELLKDDGALPANLPEAESARRKLIAEDLDQGLATLVYSDLRSISAAEKEFVNHMMEASKKVDALYATNVGMDSLRDKVAADDKASQSAFRRNWGPKCVAPKTEKNPACSAISGSPVPVSDLYPASLQSDPKFCEKLEKHPDAKKILDPFVAVREKDGKLTAVPYTEAYKESMTAIAGDLRKAADAIAKVPNEEALRAYLTAAAQSFTDNNWLPADEAWSKMNAQNSKWYVRVAPDETYWEPCNHKAGFHVTFARINTDSLAWQQKLTPIQQDMENALGTLIGKPYASRKVTFHLPDFIDIVINGGDDRDPLGATIGQSLPNWGPVANEGRGRTVAMSNLYNDPDSRKIRQSQAESLLMKDSMGFYVNEGTPGLLATILHEASHNLGPAHEYKYNGKKDSQWFGGGLASMMEELKAQTGGLWLVDLLLKKGVISQELAKQTYTDCVVWAFGHISRGMYTDTGQRKAYSQLAAIEMGFLIDEGALTWDPNAKSANTTDVGAFTIHFDKFPTAVEKLMKKVGQTKATGDKASAEALAKKYVDGTTVPQKVITERLLRFPKVSFVYAVDM